MQLRTRILRGGAEDEPWELWQRRPHPELEGLVAGLWAGAVSSPCRHRVLPGGEASLMFHLGAAQRLVERDGVPSDELLRIGFVSGLQERPSTFESFAPRTRVVCARLSPLGAWLVLRGLPQVEIAHRVNETTPRPEIPAAAVLYQLAIGHYVSRALALVAKLGVADLIGEQPCTICARRCRDR